MNILVDTNVLLRSAEREHPQSDQAAAAIANLGRSGHELVLVPQIVYELWVVATRPVDRNGLGLEVQRVDDVVTDILQIYSLFHDDPVVFQLWREYVVRYSVLGKPAHDARLVAAMLRHRVTHLLTFNGQDFDRYAEISVISPAGAASFPPAA